MSVQEDMEPGAAVVPGSLMDPQAVRDLVGDGAFERGQAYVDQGRVVAVARNGDRIVAQIAGSGGRQYVTVVHVDGPEPQARIVSASCSCPVRTPCKHVAAALLAYQAKQRQPPRVGTPGLLQWADRQARAAVGNRGWRTLLADVLPAEPAEPEPGHLRYPTSGRVTDVLGLQFELIHEHRPRELSGPAPAPGDARVRLSIRPVIRRDGRWIRSGVSWYEVMAGSVRYAGHPRRHVSILQALYRLADSQPHFGAENTRNVIYADEVPGSTLWALLTDARRVGLPLVMADPLHTPVDFHDEPARTHLSVKRDPQGGLLVSANLQVAPTARQRAAALEAPDEAEASDQAVAPAPVRHTLVGSPPQVVATWRSGMEPRLTPVSLASLDATPDDVIVTVLSRSEPLRIPASDVAEFLRDGLPELEHRVDVLDLGEAIERPARPAPTLVLVVRTLPGHVTRLAWEWRYGADASGRGGTVQPLDTDPRWRRGRPWSRGVVAADASLRRRDLTAEDEIVDQVRAASLRFQRVVSHLDAFTGSPYRGALDSQPRADELHGMDTVAFFTTELPALQALAERVPQFRIELPAGGVPDYRQETDIDVSVTAEPTDARNDWFDLAVVVRAGDTNVPFADVFTALASGSNRLILPDGRYFTLDDERFAALAALIADAQELGDALGRGQRVSRYQAGLFRELADIGALGESANAWRDALGGLAQGAQPAPLPAPEGLVATLRPYQQTGFEWMTFLYRNRLGGVLADDMGLGKTVQTLALITQAHADAQSSGESARPFLVVAPTSVVGNWEKEAATFAPGLRTVSIGKTQHATGTALTEQIAGADLVVTSYTLFRLDAESYREIDWAGLILDEAQFVKNPRSMGYRAARDLAAPVTFAITGTPLENSLTDLWAITSLACPGLFPDPARFAEYFRKPIERAGDPNRLAVLRERIAPFVLRRTKEAVAADLPAKTEHVATVTLHPKHRALYDMYLQRERARVLGLVDDMDAHRFEVFRSLALLRQASLDVSLVDPAHQGVPSAKLEMLFDLLDSVVAEGHSVLVFSQFTRFLGRVKDGLDARGLAYSYLDGSTPTRRRRAAIEEFSEGKTSVFLISLKAGGFGLNLTAADYCVLLDPWWNPAAEAQAVDRAHRIGQDRPVVVYRLVAENTIEEKVMALKESKARLFTGVLGAQSESADGDVDGADGGADAAGGRPVRGARGITADDVRAILG